MTPPIFHLGDEVEVIGTDRYGNDAGKKTLTICMMWADDGKTFYSDRYSPWYPASSLRLVEEDLKIGDWAEVVNPECIDHGRVFQVEYISDGLYAKEHVYFGKHTNKWYASDLRKLTPEEVQAHMNPGKPIYEYPTTPAKDFDDLTLRDIARMSGICKNEHGVWISTLLGRAHKNEERLSAIEKRLAFVEKIQHEQDDLIGRAIRD